MLYAKSLSVAAKLYNLPDLAREAEQIRDTIRRQSFDGEFFVDNAVRRDGKLQVTRNRTEVCQYFAFFFDVATPESHPRLWQVLMTDFGPQRKQTKAHAEVHPANAFVGNVLRFELLSRGGRGQQILDESIGYLLYMADRTGTLWENDGDYASCNHGFASHAAHVFFRDVLGLYRVDTVNKQLQVRFSDLKLDWCDGAQPTPDGPVTLRWRKEGSRLTYKLSVPAGYRVDVVNQSGKECVWLP
jgi:alpha-L-rhamnosidase